MPINVLEAWSGVEGSSMISSREIEQPCGERLQIVQLRAIEQATGDSCCGYYCLFYISCVLDACFCQNQSSAQTVLGNLLDDQAYVTFKDNIQSELLQELCREGSDLSTIYPETWNKEAITEGSMSRSYFPFLKQRCLIHDSTPLLLEFGLTSLKTNHLPTRAISEVADVAAAFHSIQNSRKSFGFLVGATIHFLSFTVHRVSDDLVQLIYIDPQGADILFQSEKQMQEVVSTMKFVTWLERGWPIDTMRKLQMDCFRGVRFVSTLLQRVISRSDFEVTHHFLELNIGEFLEQAPVPLESAAWRRNYQELRTWCSSSMPPAMIETNVLRVLISLCPIPLALRQRMRQWREDMRATLVEALLCADHAFLVQEEGFIERMFSCLDIAMQTENTLLQQAQEKGWKSSAARTGVGAEAGAGAANTRTAGQKKRLLALLQQHAQALRQQSRAMRCRLYRRHSAAAV
jgi:hypothetical protein